jgi:hypothetical protein
MTIQQHASFDSSAAELNATSKIVKAWESKNAKNAAKAGGISLMALSLAACGGSSTPTEVKINVSNLGDLTSDTDTRTGTNGDDIVFSGLVHNPGGTDRVNSLQNEDSLSLGAGTDTLNLTMGNNNDNGGTEIAPILMSVEVVNVQFTSEAPNGVQGGAFTGQLNLEFSDGTQEVNVDRMIGDNTAAYSVIGMESATDTLSVSGAPNDAILEFNYREGAVEGPGDTLALDLSGVRLSSLDVTIGNRADTDEDEEMSFEVVNITTGGNYANVDVFTFAVDGDDSDFDALDQDVTVTLSVDTEVNSVVMPGADSLTVSLGAFDLDITADETDNGDANTDANGDAVFGMDDADVAMTTGNLNSVIVTGSGDVRMNGIGGEVVATEFDDATLREDADTAGERYTENDTGVTIDASAMTGRFMTNIDSAIASDDDSSLVSGSGDDYIDYMGALNHAADTGAGNDYIEASNMLGLGSITTGAGDDMVDAGDMGAFGDTIGDQDNGGRDSAASIDTGAGDDTVTVGDMANSVSWDNNVIEGDENADDRYVVNGTSVSMGDGADTLTLGSMAEQATVNTGAGNDTVSFDNTTAASTMAADTDSDIEVTAIDETITTETTTEDFTGATLSTGAGDDTLNWVEADLTTAAVIANNGALTSAGVDAYEAATIVAGGADANVGTGEDRGGAIVDMGAGADTLNVSALDVVTLATASVADADGVTDADALNVEDLFVGVETLNLTTLNEVDGLSAAATSATENDEDEGTAAIVADIERFDSDLATINLVAAEDALSTGATAGSENYEAGTAGTFTLMNVRDQAISLSAREATGVTANLLADDTTADVNLTVSLSDADGFDDTFTLEIAGNTTGNAGADFDLDFTAAGTDTDLSSDAAATGDDDTGNIENLVFNITDGSSHAFALNGFGDAANTNDTTDATVAGTADTSVTVTGSADGETVVLSGLDAKTITANIAADVELTVGDENHYTITTGSGDDTIDMIASNVQADSSATADVDEFDRIDAGAGEDIMIVDGSDNLGSGTNDDVWENISSVEHLHIKTAGGDTQTITIDEDAEASGLEDITIIDTAATDTLDLTLVIGDDFQSDNMVYGTGDAFIVDATAFEGNLALTLDNRDDDTDVQVVHTDIKVDSSQGVVFTLTDLGDDEVVNRFFVEAAVGANTAIGSGLNGANDGQIDLNVPTAGELEAIILIDAAETDDTAIDKTEGLGLTVTLDDAYNDLPGGGTLLLDASAILDAEATEDTTDANAVVGVTGAADTTTGGATLDGSAEDDAVLTIRGTQNDDTITGGALGGTLSGNGGDDEINGGDGDDTIDGGAGNDELNGEGDDDTITGGAGDDTITGGAGQNTLTGGDGADSFVWTSVANTTFTDIDTVTDFETGSDTLSFVIDAGAGNIVTIESFASGAIGEGSLENDETALGDAYWNSEDGVLHIDVNGDADITDGVDYQLTVSDTVAAADLDFVVHNFTTTSDDIAVINTAGVAAGSDAGALVDLAGIANLTIDDVVADTAANIATLIAGASADQSTVWTDGGYVYETDTGNLYYDADGDLSEGLDIVATLYSDAGTTVAVLAAGDVNFGIA